MDRRKVYNVSPFNPVVPEKESPERRAVLIAQQMHEAINRAAAQGWVFEDYEEVRVALKPGCLGAIFSGGRQEFAFYGMLVFSRTA